MVVDCVSIVVVVVVVNVVECVGVLVVKMNDFG